MAEETILGQIGAKTFEKIPKDIQRPITKEVKAGLLQTEQNVKAAYTAPDVMVDKEDPGISAKYIASFMDNSIGQLIHNTVVKATNSVENGETPVDAKSAQEYIKGLPKGMQDEILRNDISTREKLSDAIAVVQSRWYYKGINEEYVPGIVTFGTTFATPLVAIPGYVGKQAITKAATGSGLAAADQMFFNYVTDQPLDKNVGLAAGIGGSIGLVGHYAGKAFFKDSVTPKPVYKTADGRTITTKSEAKAYEQSIHNETLTEASKKIPKKIVKEKAIQPQEELAKKIANQEVVPDAKAVSDIAAKHENTIKQHLDEKQGLLTEHKLNDNTITKVTADKAALEKATKSIVTKTAPVINKLHTSVENLKSKLEESIPHRQQLEKVDADIKIQQSIATSHTKTIKYLEELNTPTAKEGAKGLKEALKETKDKLKALKAEAKVHYTNAESIFSKKMEKELAANTAKLDEVTNKLTVETENMFNKLNEHKKTLKEARVNKKLLQDKLVDSDNVLSELQKMKGSLPKVPEELPKYAQDILKRLDDKTDDVLDDSSASILANREIAHRNLDDLDVEDNLLDDSLFSNVDKGFIDPIDNLAAEVKEISSTIKTLDDIKASPLATNMPQWLMKKILVSPIARLSTSTNEYVRGLASKLHEPTIYTGFVEQHNANIVRKELDTQLNRTFHELIQDWKQYKLTTNPAMKLEEYNALVMNEAYNVVGNIQHYATRGIDGGLPAKERAVLINKRMSSATKQFTEGLDPTVKLSVQRTFQYFEDVHARGKSAGLPSFNTSASQGYLPRSYNIDKIEAIGKDKAKDLIYDAQVKYATLTNRVITDVERQEFRDIAEGTVNLQYDAQANYGRTVTTIEKGRPVTPLKERTIQALDSDLVRILDTNLENTLVKYKTATHGKIALQETVGVQNLSELENKILNQIPDITIAEKEDMLVVGQTILGTREMSTNPFSMETRAIKGLSTFSSAISMMGFAPASMTEISAIIGEYGFKNFSKNFLGSHVDVYNIYKNGTASDKNLLWAIGEFGEANFNHRAVRMEADGGLDSVGKAQTFLDAAVNKGAKWGGLQGVTDLLRIMTTGANLDFIAKKSIATKLSRTDKLKLDDMGISLEKLAEIKKVLKVDKDGLITNTDRTTWNGLDTDISRASLIMADRVILKPSSATLPQIMTDYSGAGWTPRLLAKFLRFPVESHERLLVRGFQEADINRLVGFAANVALWTAIIKIKDAALHPDKQQYAEDTEETNTKLFKNALFSNSVTAGVVSMADLAYGTLTGKSLMGFQHNLSAPTKQAWDVVGEGKLQVSLPFGKTAINFNYNNDEDTLTNKIADSTVRFYNNIYTFKEFLDGTAKAPTFPGTDSNGNYEYKSSDYKLPFNESLNVIETKLKSLIPDNIGKIVSDTGNIITKNVKEATTTISTFITNNVKAGATNLNKTMTETTNLIANKADKLFDNTDKGITEKVKFENKLIKQTAIKADAGYIEASGLKPINKTNFESLAGNIQDIENKISNIVTTDSNINKNDLALLKSGLMGAKNDFGANTKNPPIILVDKKTNVLSAYSPEGKLMFKIPVLTGKSKEDVKKRFNIPVDDYKTVDKVTPSGVYYAKLNKTKEDEKADYGDAIYDFNQMDSMAKAALHNTPVSLKSERDKLYNKDSESRRISYGCINLRPEDFKRLRALDKENTGSLLLAINTNK